MPKATGISSCPADTHQEHSSSGVRRTGADCRAAERAGGEWRPTSPCESLHLDGLDLLQQVVHVGVAVLGLHVEDEGRLGLRALLRRPLGRLPLCVLLGDQRLRSAVVLLLVIGQGGHEVIAVVLLLLGLGGRSGLCSGLGRTGGGGGLGCGGFACGAGGGGSWRLVLAVLVVDEKRADEGGLLVGGVQHVGGGLHRWHRGWSGESLRLKQSAALLRALCLQAALTMTRRWRNEAGLAQAGGGGTTESDEGCDVWLTAGNVEEEVGVARVRRWGVRRVRVGLSTSGVISAAAALMDRIAVSTVRSQPRLRYRPTRA